MGTLEQEVAAVSSQGLLAGLDFRSGQTADYILERQFQNFPAQTSVPNNPTNRTARIHVSEGSPFRWCDASTMRFSFKLTNTSGAPMQLLTGPWGLFARARLLCRGVLVHDDQHFARTTELWSRLVNKLRIEDDQGEVPWDKPFGPGETRRFMMWPGFGLLQSPQLFILEFCPPTFEYDCVPDADMACVDAGNTWEIWDPQISADILLLDAAFAQQYSSSILSGNPISYHISCATTMLIAPPGSPEFTLQIARAFSYVKTIYSTFWSNNASAPALPNGVAVSGGRAYVSLPAPDGSDAAASQAYYDAMVDAGEYQKRLDRTRRHGKEATYFYAAGQNEGTVTDLANVGRTVNETYMEVQAIWGSRTFPAQPIRGYTQAYSSLRRALSQCVGGSVDITREQFESDSFVIALNCEKARSGGSSMHASYSGLSSMGGENLILQFKGMRNNTSLLGTGKELRCYITLVHDQSIRVRADGVEVLI